jgi:uncharacterized protein (TIGR02265 family)
MGYNAIQNYFDRNRIGLMLRTAAKIMGPERGTKQFLHNIRLSLPFGQHEFEEVRPHYARYRIRGVAGSPGLMRGILKASLEITGAKAIKIRSTALREEDVIHEMEWLS